MSWRVDHAPRPFIVIEGPRAAVGRRVTEASRAAERDGWRIVVGWAAPLTGERVVCTGTVATADDARRALLAAVTGAGLIVAAQADRETIDRFLDDLGGFGVVNHLVGT